MTEAKRINFFITTKNYLTIILVWILVVFLLPSGGSWWFEDTFNDPTLKGETIFFAIAFLLEFLFLLVCWGYSSIIKREWRRFITLSIICFINFILVFLLRQYDIIKPNYISLIHPISLSLFFAFIIEKRYFVALLGYILGLTLSLTPLLYSIAPILIFHSWINASIFEEKTTKLSAFLFRLFIYNMITIFIITLNYAINSPKPLSPYLQTDQNLEIALFSISIAISYYFLVKYINSYYRTISKANNLCYYLSFIPILWVIPLFSIPFERRNK